MTDLSKAKAYTKPGAIVPVNIQTTQLLVEALRKAPEMRTDRLRDYLKLLCQEIETAASMIEDKTVSEYLKKLSETYKGKLYE